MANDDLFNVDFNQLSEGSEKIDLSEAMVEPTKVPEGETVTLKEDVPVKNSLESFIMKEVDKKKLFDFLSFDFNLAMFFFRFLRPSMHSFCIFCGK